MQRISLILLALCLASCAAGPVTNRYQRSPDASTPAQGAVVRLRDDARAALDAAAYPRAIEYLQRAIRIEPRDARSWQMLAETYRLSGDAGRCVEMAQRAASYGSGDAAFEADNRRLLAACGE